MSLKETIEDKLRISAHIRMGAPGSLDVFVNGGKIYSKKESGRLPSPDEIIELIRASQ